MPDHNDDIELRSESVKDILTRVPPWLIRWGNLLLLALLFLVFILSWVIKYPDTLKAEALLTTETPPQPVFAKISAQFDTIFVSDHQTVLNNEVLAILDNIANSKDVFYLKAMLDSTVFNQNNIEFPFNRTPLLLLGELEPELARFENSYYQYKTLEEYQPYQNTEFASRISLNELRDRLANIKLQKEVVQNKLDIEKNDLDRNQKLLKKGVVSNQDFENKQSEYYTELSNFQNLDATESRIRENIANASNVLKGSRFNKSNEKLKLLKEVFQSYNNLKKSIRDWEFKYVLKSKIEGQVSFLEYWSENQSVEDGDLVFKVLPVANTDYIVKLNVAPQSAGKLKIGQKVNISLWDFPEYEFGVIRGEISNISRTTDSKGVYKVNVSIPHELVSSYGKKLEFRQEMKGTATIILEELRLIERLFYQFRGIFHN